MALDWAFCGRAALGQELSALIGASAAFGDSDPADWEQIEADAVAAYTAGLEMAGFTRSEADVRTGYLISLSLRFGIALLPSLAGITLYPQFHDQVAAVWGCSYEEFVVNSAAFYEFLQERIRRTLALIAT